MTPITRDELVGAIARLGLTAKQAAAEMGVKPDTIKLYVRDHDKPLSVKEGSAKLTLLTGTDKFEVTLAPAGEALETKGTFAIIQGTKAVAVVSLPGKKVTTVRFVVQ